MIQDLENIMEKLSKREPGLKYMIVRSVNMDAVDLVLTRDGKSVRATYNSFFLKMAEPSDWLDAALVLLKELGPGPESNFVSSMRCKYCKALNSYAKGECRQCGASQ